MWNAICKDFSEFVTTVNNDPRSVISVSFTNEDDPNLTDDDIKLLNSIDACDFGTDMAEVSIQASPLRKLAKYHAMCSDFDTVSIIIVHTSHYCSLFHHIRIVS